MRFERLKSCFLMLTLLFFSGNPLATFLFGKFSAFVGLLIAVIIVNKDFKIERKFLQKYRLIFIGIFIIAICQYLILPYTSLLGIVNLLLKILLGGFIIWNLKENFPIYFFKVLGVLSFISLLFFLSFNLTGNIIPSIDLGRDNMSIVIYTFSLGDGLSRNSGMFWEPGAFAGILTLCLALNLNNLSNYWYTNKFFLISIIIALLSTQSTTGYLVGFIILIFIFLKPKHFGISLVLLPLLISIGTYIYQSNEFLKDKIESQFEKSQTQNVGEFSNSRFGSLVFDWHYIQKHPFIGNGLDKQTRYSDHQYLFIGEEGDAIASGNSLSHYWASMGLFFIIGYFVLIWKATVKKGKLFALLIIFVVFLNLMGEQWFNYPLYLGLPFFMCFQDLKIKPSFSNINSKHIKTSSSH